MRPNYYGNKTDGEKKSDRWTKDCEAAKLLRSGLESGEIDPNDPPKTIYETYPLFQQYDLTRFRAALNKIKAEKGYMLRKKTCVEGGGHEEDGKPFASDLSTVPNRFNLEDMEDIVKEVGWMPIHTMFTWDNSQLREQITILVVMPTGIGVNYTVGVTGGGTKLEITVDWPPILTDATKLHEPFQKLMEITKKTTGGVDNNTQDFITKIQAFRKHLKDLEQNIDRLQSKAQINLTKMVQPHNIESNAIGQNDDGTRLLYINLLCESTESNKQRGSDYFVV